MLTLPGIILRRWKWAQTVPNTRHCHKRQLEEDPAGTTQIWYIPNHYLRSRSKTQKSKHDTRCAMIIASLSCKLTMSPTKEHLCELEVFSGESCRNKEHPPVHAPVFYKPLFGGGRAFVSVSCRLLPLVSGKFYTLLAVGRATHSCVVQ